MITEAAIIGMFLYGHYLKTIVSVSDDTRQYIVLELAVCAYLLSILRHSYVTFIYEQRIGLGPKLSLPELIGVLGVPDLCREDFGSLILHYAIDPCRDTLAAATVPIDMQFIQIEVLDGQTPFFLALNW